MSSEPINASDVQVDTTEFTSSAIPDEFTK